MVTDSLLSAGAQQKVNSIADNIVKQTIPLLSDFTKAVLLSYYDYYSGEAGTRMYVYRKEKTETLTFNDLINLFFKNSKSFSDIYSLDEIRSYVDVNYAVVFSLVFDITGGYNINWFNDINPERGEKAMIFIAYEKFNIEPDKLKEKEQLKQLVVEERIKQSLVYAVYHRDANKLKELLPATKGELNRKMKKIGASLHIACTNGDFQIVKLLVQAKANINITDHNKDTPVLCAVRAGNREISEYLIENGADVTLTGGNHLNAGLVNRNILEYAIYADMPVDFIDYLIEKGASPNHINGRNHTLFVEAAAAGRFEALKYFEKIGINLIHVNNTISSLDDALWWAISYSGSGEIIDYLFSSGADFSKVIEYDSRLLYRLSGDDVSENRNLEVIKALIRHGIDFKKVYEGETQSPYRKMIEYNRIKVLDLFD